MNGQPGMPQPHTSRALRILLAACGSLALLLGIIGIFLPLLPTTPFVLLAAACFARSSTRLHNALLAHQLLGPIIREWQMHRSMPPGIKPWAFTLMLLSFGSSMLLVSTHWHRLLLAALAAVLSYFLLRVPVRADAERPRPGRILGWLDANVFALGREMRLSYLPPLMVYVAAGIQGLTGIVGTFFVKDYLGLSAEFLATLGFWAGIPWALKMPLGHLVDLMWRHKNWLVYLGAALIATSLSIMALLIGQREAMAALMHVNAWYVLATLLAPIGYVLQDAVADAMTVEAVPHIRSDGTARPQEEIRTMHTTMQTLGRVAIIGGSVLVALANLWLFDGSEALPRREQAVLYRDIYLLALLIPLVSIAGLILAGQLRRRQVKQLQRHGLSAAQIGELTAGAAGSTPVNWSLLGGSAVFALFTLLMGISEAEYGQEVILAGSLGIIALLMARLTRALTPDARRTLLGTALLIFMFRAAPSPGAGVTWWSIDALGFDPHFFATLSLIASALTLAGMFALRRFMAERSMLYVIVVLTIAQFLLSLPTLAMSLGLHQWTAMLSGGLVDAHFIALVDTALSSPLGQIAMIPMLVWIANSAPPELKATYFAVMASFTNLALSASELGTKYLNRIFTLTREVRDAASGALMTPADYSELTPLLLAAMLAGMLLPLLAIALTRLFRLQTE
ncbi:DUF454 family protein [Craterilacuibacter sp.]|uniref:DUF454 family protein n=1 Tax=Craterilacuibacter sp. TaxID=2870909 RepID=UPI003F344B44